MTTVMVEIWLYVVYVAAIFLCFRRGIGAIFLSALAVAFLSGLFYVSLHPDVASWWHNGSLVGFAPYWWLGAALVSDRFATGVRKMVGPLLLAWVCLTALLISGVVRELAFIEADQLILALLCGLVIKIVDRQSSSSLGKIAVVGRAGYSIYALHAPIVATMLVAGAPWWFAASVVIVFGFASYFLFERPLNVLGRKLTPPL